MPDLILHTTDKALFNPTFGIATIISPPGTLIGTGKDKINGKPVCIEGDEKKVIVPGCAYITPECSIPGVGTLTIKSLASDQKAKKTKSKNKPVLLKGSEFKAKFQVIAPALQPGSQKPDTTTQYSGSGKFLTTNQKVKGS